MTLKQIKDFLKQEPDIFFPEMNFSDGIIRTAILQIAKKI